MPSLPYLTQSLQHKAESGGVQNDSTIRELEGVMNRVGADQGGCLFPGTGSIKLFQQK